MDYLRCAAGSVSAFLQACSEKTFVLLDARNWSYNYICAFISALQSVPAAVVSFSIAKNRQVAVSEDINSL